MAHVPSTPTPSPHPPARRGVLERLGERAVSIRAGLPPATTSYQVVSDLPVPMRDGVTLLADHYAPTSPAIGTLLLRGPYGRTAPPARVMAGVYARRGYHVAVVSSRGTYGSEGFFDPGHAEIPDGADTVAWLRAQPWFTGTFSTVGGSYLGYAQWAMLTDPPPDFDTAVITMGPHDLGRSAWSTGSFALGDFLAWADQIAGQTHGGWIRQLIRSTKAPRRLRPVEEALPLNRAALDVLGPEASWYESWLEHEGPDGEYWARLNLSKAFGELRRPLLLTGGWQDVFLEQTLQQYRALRARGADVAMVIGPWTHGEGGGAQIRESLNWLAGHRHPTPVRIFVTGADEWRDLPDWPPTATDHVLHPTTGAGLAAVAPDPSTDRFTYDPADPTPSIGGRRLAVGAAGFRDDGVLASRPDVLAYTGAVLDRDLEVIGHPRVELDHATDLDWADLAVRISEVDSKGVSRNVADGYVRLGRDRPSSVHLELDGIAHRFAAGHRIRLTVAGGAFPRYARNLGTGDPAASGTAMTPCEHVLTLGAGTRLVLPTA